MKAIVVLWTENSVGSSWVRAEAGLAFDDGKLISLRDPTLNPKSIPLPFTEGQMAELGNMPKLLKALAFKGVKPHP